VHEAHGVNEVNEVHEVHEAHEVHDLHDVHELLEVRKSDRGAPVSLRPGEAWAPAGQDIVSQGKTLVLLYFPTAYYRLGMLLSNLTYMYIIYCTVCTQHTTTCWLFITAHCLLPRLPSVKSKALLSNA
jgi:hypothetical protein